VPLVHEGAADPAAHRQGDEREDEHAKRDAAQRRRLQAARLQRERAQHLQRAERDEKQGEDLAGSDHVASARSSPGILFLPPACVNLLELSLEYESRIWCTHFHPVKTLHVATVLDKELKRQVTVDGVDYTVAVDPEGIRLTGKGKRRPEVELRWIDLLSGEAAMAVALNASLTKREAITRMKPEQSPDPASQRAPKKRPR
jgi:hypothetical protein